MSILLRKLMAGSGYMNPDPGSEGGGGSAGGGTGSQPSAADPGAGKESFSREYVHELREENKGWRLKASNAEKAAAEAAEAAKKLEEKTKADIENATKAANDRIVRAELKAIAIKAGMIDLDVLKLVDLSKVTLNDDGSVEGADALIEDMKKNKPHFFKEASDTSTPGKPPSSKTPEAKKATEMTDEEYAAARAKIK